MKYRCLMVIVTAAALLGYMIPESFAHDGVHKSRPNPFTECKYVVETIEDDRGRHVHHYHDRERCWVTDETYVIAGLGMLLVAVLAVSYNSRRHYYVKEENTGLSFTTAPTLNLKSQELGLRFNLNW